MINPNSRTVVKSLYSVLAILILTACASVPPQPQPMATERMFHAPKAAVWPIAVAELGLEYPIRSAEPRTGLIITDAVSLPVGNWNVNKAIRRWVLPPDGNILMGYSSLRVAINLVVTEPGAGKTQIAVRAHYEALQGPLGSPGDTWVAMSSNGSLEQEILNRVESKMALAQAR